MEDKTKFDYEGFAARLRAFLRNEGVQMEVRANMRAQGVTK